MAGKICGTCNGSIGRKIKLQCGDCRNFFHLQCGGVSEADARVMQEEKTPWGCIQCSKKGYTSRRSVTYSQPVEDIELKTLIRELQSDIREMRKSMDFLNEKYEEEKARSKVMSDMITEISKENHILKQEVQRIKDFHNIMEQNKIKPNVCITGLLQKEDNKDSAKPKLKKLFDHISVKVPESVFNNIKFITARNNETKVVLSIENLETRKKKDH